MKTQIFITPRQELPCFCLELVISFGQYDTLGVFDLCASRHSDKICRLQCLQYQSAELSANHALLKQLNLHSAGVILSCLQCFEVFRFRALFFESGENYVLIFNSRLGLNQFSAISKQDSVPNIVVFFLEENPSSVFFS